MRVVNSGTNTDVSEQKRAEEALRRAGNYNRSLIEASLDPLVTIGPDGRITGVNAATEQAAGLDRKELAGTDFSEYFTDPDRARAGYQRVFREGDVRDYPLEIRHRNGQTTPVLFAIDNLLPIPVRPSLRADQSCNETRFRTAGFLDLNAR
jgi:PAS domain S-box-containing protein